MSWVFHSLLLLLLVLEAAVEILACPHCDRLFRTSPSVFGKKIRCRGCRQIFHVPKDTSSVPLGRDVLAAGVTSAPDGPPLAVECVVDGRDARRCPACSRTFAMKSAFIGKVIRCRGCKTSFRVAASQPPVQEAAKQAVGSQSPVSPGQFHSPPRPMPPPVPPSPPPPTIFDDIGDVLDELVPGEKVASVVRPPNAAALYQPADNPAFQLIAIVFGGVCAIPMTLILLRFISPTQFEKVSAILPDFLTAWLR